MAAPAFPYAFSPQRKIGQEFGRVLRQISVRLGKLRQPQAADETEEIHEIRTTLKLLRALLWFARPILTPATAALAKMGLQNAAQLLAPGRDLTAMHTVLETLAAENDSPAKFEAILRTASLLHDHAPRLKTAARLRQRHESVALAQKTIRLLIHATADVSSWKSPRKRIRKARVLTEKAKKIASAEPTPEHLHDWRKKTKRLLYLLQLFHPKPKGKNKRVIRTVDDLQHHLGDHHDTVVQESVLKKNHPEEAADPEFQPLVALLDARLKRLRKKARKTARKL